MLWDVCTVAALGVPFERAQYRETRTLSGGEQKRLVLEALLRGPDEVLLLDEPDNYLDVPGKEWLEQRLAESPKTVLFVVARPGAAGAYGDPGRDRRARRGREHDVDARRRLRDVPPGAGRPLRAARGAAPALGRGAREAQGRWCCMYKAKAAYNDGMASRYQAAQTRLREVRGGRAAAGDRPRSRACGCGSPAAAPASARWSASGSSSPGSWRRSTSRSGSASGWRCSARTARASRTSCGCSRPAAATRTSSTGPSARSPIAPVAHTGVARLGARVRPGWFAQTHEHPELVGRTLLEVLHRGDDHRDGMGREAAARKLDRYELAHASEQTFETLSGGQQARFQILLLELSGATLLLLDEPTDNLDLASAEALEDGLAAFEGTVLAVTHDRWFARGLRPVRGLRRRRHGPRGRPSRSGTRAEASTGP